MKVRLYYSIELDEILEVFTNFSGSFVRARGYELVLPQNKIIAFGIFIGYL